MTEGHVVRDGWRALGGTPLERRVYGVCLAVVCIAFIAPLWVGEIPPLTDFGGTLSMVEVYIELEENALFEARFTRNEGLLPNLLVAQIADGLAPTISPMTTLRLLLSLSLLGVAGGLLLLTFAFGRSPWMVFLGMPMAWSGIFALGMVGFSLSLPLILFVIAAGAWAGRKGGGTPELALLLIGLLAFFLLLALHKVRRVSTEVHSLGHGSVVVLDASLFIRTDRR